MPRVYIETTIPSFYFETRTRNPAPAWRAATRLWWDRLRDDYALCTSAVVIEELSLAPPAKSGPSLRLLEGVTILEGVPRVTEVAEAYLAHRLIPVSAMADALHLAFASVHGVDFLLTWNCKHLANANKARHIAVVNTRLKLSIPIVTTPLTLLPEVPDETDPSNPR